MSSGFWFGGKVHIVANMRFHALVTFAVAVGGDLAITADEVGYVGRFASDLENMCPGFDLEICKQFPSQDERMFWSRLFLELRVRLLARNMGNPDPPHTWRESASEDARIVSELFAESTAGSNCAPNRTPGGHCGVNQTLPAGAG